MKVDSYILGRSTWIMRVNNPPGGIYIRRAVEALQERYGFVDVPKTLAEYDEAKGVHFRHGIFTVNDRAKKKEITIDDFSVYSDGIIADTRSSTAHSNSFLEDVVKFCAEKFGSIIPPAKEIEKYDVSNLEVSMNSHMDNFCSISSFLSKQLSGCLTRYGIKHQKFEVTSLTLNFDRKTHPSPLVGYVFQRREGAPFSSNLYFSSAPLTTEDHISMLELLDKSS